MSGVKPELYAAEDRIGTFPFNLQGMHHALLAAILDHEYGIEVRAGTICSHKLVRDWEMITDETQLEIENSIRAGDRLASYGVVRASLGVQNGERDVDALCHALRKISAGVLHLRYRRVPEHEIYEPVA